jgi:ribosomal protein S18 acetylase RimI-like enzyme
VPGSFLMRRDLTAPIPSARLPNGITLVPFTTETANTSRELMRRVYPDGLGDNNISFEGFWAWLTADSEYDPELMLVAVANRTVVGFCHCWRKAFIKNLVVEAGFRRRGLRAALLTFALEAFARRDARAVDLKTEVENIKAQSLYQRLGFLIVERVED